MPLFRAAPVFLSACLGLAGCSGGGGSCPVTTVEGCITETEYRAQLSDVVHDLRSSPSLEDRWGLATINIVDAWGHLQVVQGIDQPGDGVSVGVVDSGIDLSHPAFQEGAAAGQVTERFRLGALEETGAESSHGTAVASIIAGRANPEYTFPFTGIAPYASLKMFAIPLGDPPPPDRTIAPITLATLTRYDEDNTELYREVLAEDLDVLNLSFGFPGLIENYDDERDLRDALPNLIETLAQSGRRDKTVIVRAAGNSNERLCRPGTGNCIGDMETDHLGLPAGRLDSSSPEVLAGLTARIVELRGHSVAAVAIGEDGEIAPFSNRCGIAATWCIAAPGLRVWAAYFGPYRGDIIRGYASLSGTSIAAPMVSGGLALMDQFFRDQLSGEELVTRLFTTADRTGHYADRSTYGHGLMDLNAALSPVGVPRIAAGTAAVGNGAPVRTARLRLGSAFGDGPANAFAGQEIAGFDALGAPFWYDLGQFVGTRVPLTPSAQLRDFMAAAPTDPYLRGGTSDGDTMMAGLRLGFRETPGGADVGHARLAQDAITLTVGQPDGIVATAFTTEGDGSPQPVSGALISWNPTDAPLSPRAGRHHRRHPAPRDQRILAARGPADRRRRDAATGARPAAPRGGRGCRAVGSGRPHPGPRGRAPTTIGRPCPRGPAARPVIAMGAAVRPRRIPDRRGCHPPCRTRRGSPAVAHDHGGLEGLILGFSTRDPGYWLRPRVQPWTCLVPPAMPLRAPQRAAKRGIQRAATQRVFPSLGRRTRR